MMGSTFIEYIDEADIKQEIKLEIKKEETIVENKNNRPGEYVVYSDCDIKLEIKKEENIEVNKNKNEGEYFEYDDSQIKQEIKY